MYDYLCTWCMKQIQEVEMCQDLMHVSNIMLKQALRLRTLEKPEIIWTKLLRPPWGVLGDAWHRLINSQILGQLLRLQYQKVDPSVRQSFSNLAFQVAHPMTRSIPGIGRPPGTMGTAQKEGLAGITTAKIWSPILAWHGSSLKI